MTAPWHTIMTRLYLFSSTRRFIFFSASTPPFCRRFGFSSYQSLVMSSFLQIHAACVYCWMVSLMTMNVHVSTWCPCISPRGRAPPKKPYRYLERFPDRNCCNSMIKMIITEIIQQYAEISVSRTWIFSVELAFRVIGAMPTRMFAYIWAFQILDLPGGRTDGQATALFWKKLKNSCYSGYL